MDVALLKRRLQKVSDNLRNRIDKCTIKVSKCSETYIEYFTLLNDYDLFVVPTEPSNPCVSDSTEFWEMLEKS